jgi:hypothetical protein
LLQDYSGCCTIHPITIAGEAFGEKMKKRRREEKKRKMKRREDEEEITFGIVIGIVSEALHTENERRFRKCREKSLNNFSLVRPYSFFLAASEVQVERHFFREAEQSSHSWSSFSSLFILLFFVPSSLLSLLLLLYSISFEH